MDTNEAEVLSQQIYSVLRECGEALNDIIDSKTHGKILRLLTNCYSVQYELDRNLRENILCSVIDNPNNDKLGLYELFKRSEQICEFIKTGEYEGKTTKQ